MARFVTQFKGNRQAQRRRIPILEAISTQLPT